jgi:hypothetical protein
VTSCTISNEIKTSTSQLASVVPNAVKSAGDDIPTSEAGVPSAKGKGADLICHSADHKRIQCSQLNVMSRRRQTAHIHC